MATITLRDIQMTYDGSTLTLCSLRVPDKSVSLDAEAAGELVDFVEAVAEDSFRGLQKNDGPNRRESFRVPVMPAMELRCEVWARNYTFEADVSNISMTGVYVEQRRSDPVQFHLGDTAKVRLTCGEDTITLQAIVRRIGHNGYGFFFPITVKGSVIAPPQELRRIVMELQRRWMSFRSETA
ncbi:MAG: PilZ domain-containing protein [Planctomycetota bacterium]